MNKLKIYLDTSVISHLEQPDVPEKMKKPNISQLFSIEDIHLLREYNAEKRKKLSLEERLKDIKNSADRCEENINTYKKTQMAI